MCHSKLRTPKPFGVIDGMNTLSPGGRNNHNFPSPLAGEGEGEGA